MLGQIQVVPADGREDVDVEDRLVAGDAARVRRAGRDVEELAGAHGVRPAVELDLQRAREDERELVVGMVVRRDLRVPGWIQLKVTTASSVRTAVRSRIPAAMDSRGRSANEA
jgi:hypothetical protein